MNLRIVRITGQPLTSIIVIGSRSITVTTLSLAWERATVTAKHPGRGLLGVGGDYLDHVERALPR
jgi:hypothetical protein